MQGKRYKLITSYSRLAGLIAEMPMMNVKIYFFNFTNNFHPVDGGYGEWISWDECSSNCRQERVRYCNNPSPKGRGKQCKGESFDTVRCSAHPYCGGEWNQIFLLGHHFYEYH